MTDVKLTSTGMIATHACVPHARILAAIEELQLRPAVTLNGVRYFDAESVERIQERVNHHGATAPAAAGRTRGSN